MSEIRLGLHQSKIDQGKISELNKSSHRYQSSNTVGRMSEGHGALAFLASTKTNHGCESLLSEGKSDKKEKDFSMQMCKVSSSDLRSYLEDSVNFDEFPNASPINNITELAKKESTSEPGFATWFVPQSGRLQSTGTLAFSTARTKRVGRRTRASAVDFISMESSQFLPTYRTDIVCNPQSITSADRYAPQMGEVSETCQAATQAAANTCYQELAKWPIFDLSVAKAQLLKMSSYLEQECDFVAITFVVTMSYIAYRILSNLALLGTWMLGYATCAIGARQHQQFYTSKYSPQAGVLTSDDGAAFKGVKPKKATAASKTPKKVASSTQSTPGVTMLYKTYTSSFGGPPKSNKDPRSHDGPLNGFGVGI